MTPADDPFTRRLRTGERIIWTGVPAQGVRLRSADLFLIPFSIMWGGFAIFWEGAALFGAGLAVRSGHAAGLFGLIFPLWGVPFVVVGVYLMVGRFFHDAWVRAGVSYALTDQRALIARRRGGEALQSVELADDVQLSRLSSEGRGTVSFGSPRSMFAPGYGRSWGVWAPAASSQPQFFQIAEADRVFDLALPQTQGRRG